MDHDHRTTFTEVIIGLGIIGLLAAMVVTTLSQTDRNFNLVSCESNLRQIGIAAINYAYDNHNDLPLWSEAHLSPLRHGTHAMTAANYWDRNSFADYAPPVIPQKGEIPDKGANLFALNVGGYLGNWHWNSQPPTITNLAEAAADPQYLPIRFCAGQQKIISSIAAQWGSSYFFNPHWIEVNAGYWDGVVASHPAAANLGVTNPPMTIWYTKLSEYPPDRALASDMIADAASIAHPAGDGKSARWNLLFADGHVQRVTDEYVIEGLSGNDASPIGAGVQSMNVFDDYLDVLETEAAGADPRKTALTNREAQSKQGKTVHRY